MEYSEVKFAIESGDHLSKEAMAVSIFSTLNRYTCRKFQNAKDVPPDFIPCGSVEWCETILGKHVVPDYYPSFLQEHLHRKIWQTTTWPIGEHVFIKPSDRYKRFTGFVTNGGYRKKKKGPYWCSNVVKFENEWRYYVSNGKVLTGEWYSGDEEGTPDAPQLEITLPDGYCGALDFGMAIFADYKVLTLVEANHPFACGWYGKKHDLYAQWIIDGWNYVLKNI